MAERYGEGFAGTTEAATLGEPDQRRRRDLSSGRPCAWLGADRGRGGRASNRRLGRLQAPARPDLPSSSRCPATSSSPRRPSASRFSAIRRTAPRSASCSIPCASSPTARIWSAPMRSEKRSGSSRSSATPVTTSRSTSTARCKLSATCTSRRRRSRTTRAGDVAKGATRFRRQDRGRPAFCHADAGRGASPTLSPASPPAGCASPARQQRGVELPLVISDHADWDELTDTIRESPAGSLVTHGREEALVRWCELKGIAAKPLHLMGYEDEDAERAQPQSAETIPEHSSPLMAPASDDADVDVVTSLLRLAHRPSGRLTRFTSSPMPKSLRRTSMRFNRRFRRGGDQVHHSGGEGSPRRRRSRLAHVLWLGRSKTRRKSCTQPTCQSLLLNEGPATWRSRTS